MIDSPGHSYSLLPDASSIRLLQHLDRDKPRPLRFSLQVYSLNNLDLLYYFLSYT